MDQPEQRRLIPKPRWVARFEARLAYAIPIHPNVISTIKLLFVVPLLLLAARGGGPEPGSLPYPAPLVFSFFLAFAFLDYLDGVVARNNGLETAFGRIYDWVTDYPILFGLSLYCVDVLPIALLAAKLTLDLLLFLLFVLGMGSTENRLRTAISYSVVLSLLFLSQGWAPWLVTIPVVQALLWVNIVFSSIVVLYNTGILRARFLADALSGCNLACGVASMVFAYHDRLELSLLCLLVGAAFDGFDGAAARRFGGTRWGVYSDDVADGVNYAVAPGFALIHVLRGVSGWTVGLVYLALTVGRLVYFTLNKKSADPRYFAGLPSTVGALVAFCSLILLSDHPALLGFLVGLAGMQLVSFDTRFRHLGRALSSDRRYLWGAVAVALIVTTGTILGGVTAAAALLLSASLAYGFAPTVAHFARVATGCLPRNVA